MQEREVQKQRGMVRRREGSQVGPHHLHVIHRRPPARVTVERVYIRVPAEDLQAGDKRVPRAVARDRRVHVREHVHLAHELAEVRERGVVRGLLRLALRRAAETRVLRVPRGVELDDVGDVDVDEARADARRARGVVRHAVPDRLHRGLAQREHTARDVRAPVVRARDDRAELGEEARLVPRKERVGVRGGGEGVPA